LTVATLPVIWRINKALHIIPYLKRLMLKWPWSPNGWLKVIIKEHKASPPPPALQIVWKDWQIQMFQGKSFRILHCPVRSRG
jgi:hypothetical protein